MAGFLPIFKYLQKNETKRNEQVAGYISIIAYCS
jgi:hypothetical protein